CRKVTCDNRRDLLALLTVPFMSSNKANRRVPIYGSRFSPMPGELVSTRPLHPTALADHPN
ncbi:MAG: hypothetical protein ACOYN0_14635, partial [Phycisphaerales bacterium]